VLAKKKKLKKEKTKTKNKKRILAVFVQPRGFFFHEFSALPQPLPLHLGTSYV